MTASKTFITRHPVLPYLALTFAISWGGFVLVVGPSGFPGTGSQFDALLPLVASAMLAGPAVAGILMTGLLSGTAGPRELLSRLLRRGDAHARESHGQHDLHLHAVASGMSLLIYTSTLAGAMWIVVAAVALASSGHTFRRPIQRQMA